LSGEILLIAASPIAFLTEAGCQRQISILQGGITAEHGCEERGANGK
jgi:hypothetical protein